MLAGMLPSVYVPSGILIECSFTLFSILPLPYRPFGSVGQYRFAVRMVALDHRLKLPTACFSTSEKDKQLPINAKTT